MPGRSTTNRGRAPQEPALAIFVHATGTAPVDPAWWAEIAGLGAELFSHAPLPGARRTRHAFEQPGDLLAELTAAAPGKPLLLLRAGLAVDAASLNGLLAVLRAHPGALAVTALSNAAPEFNPFAGLAGPPGPTLERGPGAVRLMGRRVLHRLGQWPEHLVLLDPGAAQRLAGACERWPEALPLLRGAGVHVEAPEWIFVADRRARPFAAARLEPHESARPEPWGGLSMRLQQWLDAGAPAMEPPGAAGRPITLHVTHSWGGGVALWTRAFIEADDRGDHLQLRSEELQAGHGAGQCLALYLGNALTVPIARWWLQPPIRSIRASDPAYREILDEVRARFGVGRVVVSSLVGHSLDALRTGLPTVQVLHDYFPTWPLFSVHPADHLGPDGSVDLAGALSAHRDRREFTDHGPEAWAAIRDEYLQTLRECGVRVAAPTRSVADLQRRLDARWQELDIEVIEHGLPPLPGAEPVPPRDKEDGRLRLVVLGRIQPGKGEALLREALEGLRRHAQVYLLGTGKRGEAFFGLPGVSVVPDYPREKLAGLLGDIGPHAAALLSVVPETYSYTLSELRQLRIPAIATNRGSFVERIEDGVDGWLIDARAEALIERVAALAADPGALERARAALSGRPAVGMAEMIDAYDRLCPVLPAPAPAPTHQSSLDSAQAGSAMHVALMELHRLRQAEARQQETQRELADRTRWAEATDRAIRAARRRVGELEQEIDERTAWAERADQAAEQARQRVAELEAEVRERTAWARKADRQTDKARQRIAELEAELEGQRAELDRMLVELVETRSELGAAQAELRDTQAGLEALRRDHEAATSRLELVLASRSWRMTRPLRVARRLLGTLRQARAYNPLRWPLLLSKLVRHLATGGVAGTLRRLQAPGQSDGGAAEEPRTQAPQRRRGPPAGEPRVSIVVPAYNHWAYTQRCLASIAAAGDEAPYEIILVDDASSDETRREAASLDGVTCLRNDQNLGFIRSCNRGLEQARGEFTVILNNDTEVRDGWLDHLLETFEQVPDAGLVGSRLVYPDGRLQECGGLIFRDGSGWNYGRNDDPDRPEYQCLRETDYCSGACIMLRTATFRQLGGFDTRYAPAYYEDTDLAFRVRELGLKVLVQPASTVVHHEGVTSGTDVASGTKRYQEVNREKFLERWGEALAGQPAPIRDPEDSAAVRRARDHRLRGRVLVIDATTPEPDQDSGSVRLTNLMQCFRDLGFGVTFFADNRVHAGRYTRQLQAGGVEVEYLPWMDSLRGFFQQRGAAFDYVFISRHYIAVNYLALLRRHCPAAPFIFDTVDLHYLREQRLAELEDSASLRQVASQTRRSELGVVAAADATVVVSPAEVEVLAEDAPGARVHVLSNIHEVPGCRAGFAERRDLFFVGGFQHPPNIDAARWFVGEIWPLVRERLAGVRFHLIGSKAPEEVSSLEGDGVVFHGFVEDLEPYLDGCRLAVAPLRYGAGVKGKVNMSMSYGQPVVATPIAVEGMHAEDGREILVAETAEAFADQVVRLYQDEALWSQVSEAAVANVQTHFSLEAARRSLASLLDSLPARKG